MNKSLWAKITNNLAISYAFYAEVNENADALEKSIETFNQAKEAYETIQAHIEAATIDGNLGELHCKLPRFRDSKN